MQNHESAQDDEEPASHPGSCLTDLATLHSKGPRYQEGLLLSPSFVAGAVSLIWRWTQAIETLLEKEYIERVEGTRDTFAYVA